MARILIVDDDVPLLEAMSLLLSQHGYEVATCADARELFHFLISFSPDLILLDVLLGVMDGRDVCKEIKEARKEKEILIMMFSASNVDEAEVSNCHADEFIRKPFDVPYLLERIKIHLQNAHVA